MINESTPPRFLLKTCAEFSLAVCASPTASAAPVVLAEKSCALLAYLWMAERRVPREELCALLWDGVPLHDARNNLRQALFRIRRVLGAGSVDENFEG